MQLREYYDKLNDLITDADIFLSGSEKNIEKKEKMDLEIIPLLSYIIASNQNLYERIDNLYQSYDISGENLEELYNEYGMEELAKTLTPQGRVRYREIAMVCFQENTQTRKQLMKLLKRGWPNACIEGDGTEYILIQLLCGAFDVKHIVITWLSMYLEGATIQCERKEPLILKSFLNFVSESMPLPYYLKAPVECEAKTGIKFGELLKDNIRNAEVFYYLSSHMTEKTVEQLKKNRQMACKTPLLSSAFHQQNGIDTFLESSTPFSKQGYEICKKTLTHPKVEERNARLEAYCDRKDIEKEYNEINRGKQDDNSKEFTEIEKENIKSNFLTDLITMSGLSVEEIYNIDVYPEDITAVNALCVNRADFKDCETTPVLLDLLSPSEKLVALLIRILARRIHNAENAFENTACILHEIEDEDDVPEQKDQNADVINVNKQEIRQLKIKNRELIEKINVEKDEYRALEEASENEKNALTAENIKLKEMLEQLMSVQEQDDEDTDLKDGKEEIEKMKKTIIEAGTIFVCGHQSWRYAMQKEFPELRFIEPKEYSITKAIFRNINFIVYHLKQANHSMYYKCLDLKNEDTKLLFLIQSNTDHCIRLIYDYICKSRNEKEEEIE